MKKIITPDDGIIRCDWSFSAESLRIYHDTEWGVPVRDSRELFEHLVLDGFQAGLSWTIILNKREAFRSAFDGFRPEIIAGYDDDKLADIATDPGIVRNKMKIAATKANAIAWLDFQEKRGEFSEFLWDFVGGKTKINAWKSLSEVPPSSPESDNMSKELKKLGFKFVGTTICYAFMQAVGMVNDHLTKCFRYDECAKID